jgi:hypothetical protein
VKGRKSIKGREGDRRDEMRKRDGWRQSWGRMILKRWDGAQRKEAA